MVRLALTALLLLCACTPQTLGSAPPSGPDRIKAGLPEGAILFHKTGTGADVQGINGASNDVGIVQLPDGRRIAMAIFFAGSPRPAPERAAVIANTSRLLISSLAPGSAVP